MNIQRYIAWSIDQWIDNVTPHPQGALVLFADYERDVAAKDAEITQLKSRVERLSAPASSEEIEAVNGAPDCDEKLHFQVAAGYLVNAILEARSSMKATEEK